MRWFRNASLPFFVVAFATVCLAGRKVDDAADADAKQKLEQKDAANDKDKDAKEDDKAGVKGKLTLPLVEGHPSFNVKIPYRDLQGRLQATYTIGEVSRVDADHAQFANMQVETYDEQGNPDMSMDFPTSIMDLNTHVLVSHTPVTISRHDFTIRGDSVEFNADTKAGTLRGHVHMSVFDLNAATDPSSDDADSEPKEKKENVTK